MMGSDLARRLELAECDLPLHGPDPVRRTQPQPGRRADPCPAGRCLGNAQIDGYELMDGDVARAARRLVISTEAMVHTDTLRRDPARTIIPGFPSTRWWCSRWAPTRTSATATTSPTRRRSGVHGPGARPGSEGAREYAAELVAHPDHDAFMASVAPERLGRLRRDAEGMMPQ